MKISISTLVVTILAGTAAAAPFDWGAIQDQVEEIAQDVGEHINDGVEDVTDTVKDIVGDDISGTIAPADLDQVKYFAEYAAASYCATTPGQLPVVTCRDNICPALSGANITKAFQFKDGQWDSTGFVALDRVRKEIVASFRGSSSRENWMANFQFGKDDVEWCDGCSVHEGFLKAYREQPGVKEKVLELVAQNPGYRVVTSGHSLGGALATILAVDLRASGVETEMYSFGAPRVGNTEFAEFASTSGKNFRVTHREDPVPRLPPIAVGYAHVSPEYHIANKDVDIMPEDVNVLEGTLNLGGNAGTDIQPDTRDHSNYFFPGGIGRCGRKEDEKNRLPIP